MATLVTLIHNPGAGFEQYSTEDLLKELRKAGFKVNTPARGEDFTESLKEPADLVVVAGGDGTVGKIAKYLIGKEIPIGLLPLGTANNIATSLGILGKPADIIARWDLAKRKIFDVGVVKGPKGEAFFLESMGFGLFPRLIRQREEDKRERDSREEELTDALKHQMEILSVYKSHPCKIYLDANQISGKYLLVEIMNIRFAGPNMDLAPKANPGDGLLDVVLVREEEREKFAKFLHNSMRGEAHLEQLYVRRAKKLQVEWDSIHYHIDDIAHEDGAPVKVDIELLSKGLEFLLS